jgi:hypothetical protein
MRLQQLRRQGRRQGQRVDRRYHRGDRDRHRELLVELAGDAREERHRHKRSAEHQRNGDDRAGNLTHGLVGGFIRAKAPPDVVFDVFDHDDCVVNDDADGEHKPEQGQGVDGETQQIQEGEGAYHRYRHGNQRDNRRSPGLQEEDDDENDEEHRLQKRVQHRAN